MKYINSFSGGMAYKNRLETMSYPAVSLIYDKEKPTLSDNPIEGVFIEATDGTLVKTEDWDGTKTANTIYVSDGYRKVRLSLTWCNDHNCNSLEATSNRKWNESTSEWEDDGGGEPNGNKTARTYSWFLGKYTSKYGAFNNGVAINCLSYGDTWDWNGKTVTEAIMNNDDLKEHFPAMKAAYTYTNPKGEKGYLMGISELQMVFGYQAQVNAALAKCGGVAFDYASASYYPWSCSCCSTGYVWYLDTGSYGFTDNNGASYTYAVRPAF